MIELMIFDHDMTIVDSSHAILECFNRVADALGRPRVSHEGMMRHIAKPLSHFFLGFWGECRPEWVRMYKSHTEAVERAMLRPFPETVDVMGQLRGMGVRLAVASNREDPLSSMERTGLAGCFDAIVGAEVVRWEGGGALPPGSLPYKPDPAMLVMLMDHFGVPPERTAYVGDADIDIETARAAGVLPVGITRGNFTAERFMELGAWRAVETLDELIPIAAEVP